MLFCGTEVDVLVDKTSEAMAAFRIVISSMARTGVAAKDAASPSCIDSLRPLFGEIT